MYGFLIEDVSTSKILFESGFTFKSIKECKKVYENIFSKQILCEHFFIIRNDNLATFSIFRKRKLEI